jgi:prepilin-type N-terminal cleavage/methylation domain-containing protein
MSGLPRILHSLSGYTLVELLVALSVGSLAMTGMLQAYAVGRSGYEQVQHTARLHEQAQYVFSALEADLQMAGFYGLVSASNSPDTTAASDRAAGCGLGLAQQLSQAVSLSDGAYPLRCPAAGGGWLPGSDVLTVRRASASPGRADPGRLQLLTQVSGDGPSQLIANGLIPADCQLTNGRCELRDLLVHVYYVARAADGSTGADRLPALRMKSLTRVAGAATFVDTEVLPGIGDLQMQAGFTTSDSATLRYAAAAQLPADARLQAVLLSITLVSARSGLRNRPQLTLTRTFALRNTVSS